MKKLIPYFFLILLALTLPGQVFSADEEYETTAVLSAKKILPERLLRGEHHKVKDKVVSDGYLNLYTIESDYGEYEAYGSIMLSIRVNEIRAIAELDELSKTKVFIEAAADAGISQLTTIGEFVTHPIKTITGIPGGIVKMFKRYSRKTKDGYGKVKDAVTEDEEEEGGDEESSSEETKGTAGKAADAAEDYAKSYLGVTGAQRRWAAELGVDPYSSNEVLRKAIKQVARVDAAARFGMRFSGIPSIPGIEYVSTLNKVVWSMDPIDLKIHNEKQLKELGINEELVKEFSGNLWHTPTRQTLIVTAVVAMDDVENIQELILEGSIIDSEEGSRFFTINLQMLEWFHRKESSLCRVLDSKAAPVGLAADGRAVIIAATDHILWTAEVGEAVHRVVGNVRQETDGSLEAWFLGTASERCRGELEARGIKVVDDNSRRFEEIADSVKK